MSDEVKKSEPNNTAESEPVKPSKIRKLDLVPVPADALDLAELWLDPALGDGLVERGRHLRRAPRYAHPPQAATRAQAAPPPSDAP